jgi:hypothetical protein
MALTVSQIVAASYPAVLNEKRKAANQWAENAAMRAFQKQGFIKRVDFGTILEHTLDYRRNSGVTTLANDFDQVSLAKVDVLTAAQFDPAQMSVPITWSKADEAKNPSQNQKIALVKTLLENGIESHDDKMEELIFGATENGFLGLQSLVPDSGQGSPGGINAAVETWWRNHTSDYASSGADIVATLATAFDDVIKGSGGQQPTLLVSGSEAHAIYEDTLTDNKRYVNIGEGDAGFKALMFRGCPWIFSQYGGTRIYGLNKSYRLNVSKDAFRTRGETIEIPAVNGYVTKLFTMFQATTDNKSRLLVITQA